MKKNIRFLIIPLLFTFALFSCDKQGTADEDAMLKAKITSSINVANLAAGCSASVDLMAGQHYVAGKVNVTRCDGGVQVEFVTEDSWILTEVHVDVQNNPNDFPMTKSGNPKVGNFYWNVSFDPSENKTIYETDCIPVADGDIYVAAHAVVCGGIIEGSEPDFEALCASIPEYAKMENLGYNGSISYNKLDVYESGDAEFDGIYNGWCIEPGVYLWNEQYKVKLLCSLGDLSELGTRIITTNFDLINFILNQNYIGQAAGSLGAITVGDVQMAIWRLIKPADWAYDGGLEFDSDRVAWILGQTAGHKGYLPECGGVISVILLPTEAIYQTKVRPVEEVQLTLITIPVPCTPVYGGCETAWGKGFGFPGNNWFMFFKYCEDRD